MPLNLFPTITSEHWREFFIRARSIENEVAKEIHSKLSGRRALSRDAAGEAIPETASGLSARSPFVSNQKMNTKTTTPMQAKDLLAGGSSRAVVFDFGGMKYTGLRVSKRSAGVPTEIMISRVEGVVRDLTLNELAIQPSQILDVFVA